MSVCMWTGPDGLSKFSNVFLILAPKSCPSCPEGGVPEAMLGHFTAAHACAKSTPAGGAAARKLRPDIGCRFCSLDLAATWCLLTARSPAWYVPLVWFLLLKRKHSLRRWCSCTGVGSDPFVCRLVSASLCRVHFDKPASCSASS